MSSKMGKMFVSDCQSSLQDFFRRFEHVGKQQIQEWLRWTMINLPMIWKNKSLMTGAKFLWKRIPSNAKSGSTELGNIWAVGEHLWRRDLPGVYKALNREWSNNVKEIMQAVFEKTRQRAVELVGRAYTSIRAEDFAQLVGMTEEEAVKAAQGYGWGFDEATRMILPTPPTTPPQQPVPSDEQLKRLTDYIAFLEN
ncbi:COP9 signalosome subunit 8 isoform X1 [Oratosquilla oratoria]|uniref:COP9 signalosome subunit 8 isoform X1 n=1 Tax=Oratosquilla oratoria TaxID=337810 RepID=UPI003F761C35